jgi:hypothetical protein
LQELLTLQQFVKNSRRNEKMNFAVLSVTLCHKKRTLARQCFPGILSFELQPPTGPGGICEALETHFGFDKMQEPAEHSVIVEVEHLGHNHTYYVGSGRCSLEAANVAYSAATWL